MTKEKGYNEESNDNTLNLIMLLCFMLVGYRLYIRNVSL